MPPAKNQELVDLIEATDRRGNRVDLAELVERTPPGSPARATLAEIVELLRGVLKE